MSGRTPQALRGLRVEFADEGQRKERAHILKMRTDLDFYLVPAGVALDAGNIDLRLPQRSPGTHRRLRLIVRNVLLDPVPQLRFEVRTLFEGAELLALEHFDVVREAADDERIRKLRAQLEVGFRLFTFP